MKILTSSFILFAASIILSACNTPPVSNIQPLPSIETELTSPVPTANIQTTDKEDQKVIDQLNQFQDNSLDKDFNDLELSF